MEIQNSDFAKEQGYLIEKYINQCKRIKLQIKGHAQEIILNNEIDDIICHL